MRYALRLLTLLVAAIELAFGTGCSSEKATKARSDSPTQSMRAQKDSPAPAAVPAGGRTATENVKQPSQSLPVIGYLEFRDKTVTMLAGPDGARYAVSTKEGKALTRPLTAKELQAQYPSLYEKLKTGTAANDASIGGVLRPNNDGLR